MVPARRERVEQHVVQVLAAFRVEFAGERNQRDLAIPEASRAYLRAAEVHEDGDVLPERRRRLPYESERGDMVVVIAVRHVEAEDVDACLERGDMEGLSVWKRVLAAIKELQRVKPREGERVS